MKRKRGRKKEGVGGGGGWRKPKKADERKF